MIRAPACLCSIPLASEVIRCLLLGLQMRVKEMIDLMLTLEWNTQCNFFPSTLFQEKLEESVLKADWTLQIRIRKNNILK